MSTLSHEICCDALEAEIAAFADTVREADLDTPVPTCGDWTLVDLVNHLGRIHRWAATMVTELSPVRLDRRSDDTPAEHGDDLAAWLAAGSPLLVGALRAADADAQMWAWGFDQHVRFWSRRQLHETAIHHADALLALGREPAMSFAVATDGVDELLVNLPCAAYFAPGVDKLRGSGESLHLHATDGSGPSAADGEWMITLGADGFTWEHGHGKGNVAVRGSANDLALLMWGRRTVDDVSRYEVFGDRDLLLHWLTNSAL